MTATLAPFGMRPVFHPSGIIRREAGTILQSNSTAIYKGDPVAIQTTGYIAQAASGVSNGIVGVFLGCEYTLAGTGRRVTNYWPGAAGAGATDIVAYYTTDPEIIYEIQADGSVSLANMGEQTVFGLGTPNATTGISGASLTSASLSASTASQLRVVGVGLGQDNAWGDTYTIVRVQIALHQYRNRQGPF